ARRSQDVPPRGSRRSRRLSCRSNGRSKNSHLSSEPAFSLVPLGLGPGGVLSGIGFAPFRRSLRARRDRHRTVSVLSRAGRSGRDDTVRAGAPLCPRFRKAGVNPLPIGTQPTIVEFVTTTSGCGGEPC